MLNKLLCTTLIASSSVSGTSLSRIPQAGLITESGASIQSFSGYPENGVLISTQSQKEEEDKQVEGVRVAGPFVDNVGITYRSCMFNNEEADDIFKNAIEQTRAKFRDFQDEFIVTKGKALNLPRDDRGRQITQISVFKEAKETRFVNKFLGRLGVNGIDNFKFDHQIIDGASDRNKNTNYFKNYSEAPDSLLQATHTNNYLCRLRDRIISVAGNDWQEGIPFLTRIEFAFDFYTEDVDGLFDELQDEFITHICEGKKITEEEDGFEKTKGYWEGFEMSLYKKGEVVRFEIKVIRKKKYRPKLIKEALVAFDKSEIPGVRDFVLNATKHIWKSMIDRSQSTVIDSEFVNHEKLYELFCRRTSPAISRQIVDQIKEGSLIRTNPKITRGLSRLAKDGVLCSVKSGQYRLAAKPIISEKMLTLTKIKGSRPTKYDYELVFKEKGKEKLRVNFFKNRSQISDNLSEKNRLIFAAIFKEIMSQQNSKNNLVHIQENNHDKPVS